MASAQPEKKNRLSRFLGKRDKSPAEPTILPDSAYASSETPSAVPSKEREISDIVPAEKNSDIANIDKDRNLGVKPSTGEVFDQDTGEVVTVVTTTTTTTTTTTRKPGARTPDIQKDVQRDIQETTHNPSSPPQRSLPQSGGPAEMPANTSMTHQGNLAVPSETTVPDRSSSKPLPPQPPIPHRSLARKSGDFGTSAQAGPVPENLTPEPPVSPVSGHNFSYPSRNRSSMDPDGSSLVSANEPQRHSKSTMSDLRAAAKGIHGVGETLRGTLNSTIDDRFPRKDPTKAAAAQSKNEAVLARGRNEMQGINSRPEPPRTKTSDQSVPGQWSDYDHEVEKAPSPAGYGEAGEAALGENPPQNRKAASFSKFFKRKPVPGDGEQRVTNP